LERATNSVATFELAPTEDVRPAAGREADDHADVLARIVLRVGDARAAERGERQRAGGLDKLSSGEIHLRSPNLHIGSILARRT
jgi:hypothetical protein